MTRRGFIRSLGALVGAVVVGTSIVKPQPKPQPVTRRKLKVYWSPEMEKDLQDFHLVGFKGEAFLEAGYVYAPYIPLVQTALLTA